MNNHSKSILGGIGFLLGVVLLMNVKAGMTKMRKNAGHINHPTVIQRLETWNYDGWSVQALPVGETEFMQEIVVSILKYDRATFLRITKGNREFFVYLAYWADGACTAREVRHHTPDTCWEQAGWVALQRRTESVACSENQTTTEGQFRRYAANGQVQEVIFWHFMNGKLVPHWRYGQPTIGQILSALAGDLSAVRGEQYFLRISSPGSLDWLWRDPVWTSLSDVLAPIGIVPSLPNGRGSG